MVDEWITGLFAAENIDATVASLVAAQDAPQNAEPDIRADMARAALADCDVRLRRLRDAIEAGTDPELVGQWIADVQRERESAERALRADAVVRREGETRFTAAQIRELLQGGRLRARTRQRDSRRPQEALRAARP